MRFPIISFSLLLLFFLFIEHGAAQNDTSSGSNNSTQSTAGGGGNSSPPAGQLTAGMPTTDKILDDGSSKKSTSGNSSSGSGDDDNITTDQAGRMWITQPQLSSLNKVRFRTGDNLTVAWKYDDSVQVTPKNITVALSTDRRNWTPIKTLPGGTMKFIWDSGTWDAVKYGPLVTNTPYVMALYDERGLKADPEPGKVSPNMDIQFQLYSSDPNVCAACNSAPPSSFTTVTTTIIVTMCGLIGVVLSSV